jgi:hypothetical protein
MPRIDTPTLMLWGEKDGALGKDLTYSTEKYVSDLTLRYLPNVSHWVQQEAPESVNAMMEAWLLGQSVPYAPGIRSNKNGWSSGSTRFLSITSSTRRRTQCRRGSSSEAI